MTNQEINLKIAEVIAKEKGLECKYNDGILQVLELETGIYLDPGWIEPTEDYINDWALLGPLMLELLDSDYGCYKSSRCEYFWSPHDVQPIFNKNFGVATCLAYLKFKGIKV